MIHLNSLNFKDHISSYYEQISKPDRNSRDIKKIKIPDPGAYEKINPDFRHFRDFEIFRIYFPGLEIFGILDFGILIFFNFRDFPEFRDLDFIIFGIFRDFGI